MYYIACKVMETSDKVYEPGDVIPEFTRWDPMVQRAHLNQGNVERIHGDQGDLPTGRSKEDIRREAQEAEQRARQAAEEADSLVDPKPTGSGDRTHDDEGEGEDGDADDPYEALRDGGIWSCPGCEGSVFTSRGGLTKHLRKVHDGAIPAGTVKHDDAPYAKTAPPPSKHAKHVGGLMSEFGAAASTSDDD